jgi:hypothetical protein
VSAADKKLNTDLLSERAAMLADVRDEVSAMRYVLVEVLSEGRHGLRTKCDS